MFAIEDFFEAFDGVGHGHLLASAPRKHFGHRERLAQEPLNLAGAEHCELVVGRKLVHAENSDDVLQILVALEDFLDAAGHFVVFLADDVRCQRAGG